jgi:hypothetical protein
MPARRAGVETQGVLRGTASAPAGRQEDMHMNVKATALIVGLAAICAAGCSNDRTTVRRTTTTESVARPVPAPETTESTTVIKRSYDSTTDTEDK